MDKTVDNLNQTNPREYNNGNKNRNSSIELLRMIAAVGVIMIHYNNADAGGAFKYVAAGGVNQQWLYLTECCFIGSVNLFVMISAWYLSQTNKRNYKKVICLFLQVILFNELFYFLKVVWGESSFSLVKLVGHLLPINYYVILYSALYLISPYVNLAVDSMNLVKMRTFVVTVFVIFSIWPFGVDVLEHVLGISLDGLSTIGMLGSQYGYTIVNFILVYIIAAYVKKRGLKPSKGLTALVATVLMFILYGISNVELSRGCVWPVVWNYDNPIVIVLAMSILIFFDSFEFYNRIINELAKAVLVCYLMHGFVIQRINIESWVNRPLPVLVLHQLIISVVLYLWAYVIYKIGSVVIQGLIGVGFGICKKKEKEV